MILIVIFSSLVGFGLLSTTGLAEERPIAAAATETKPLDKGQKAPEANLIGLDGVITFAQSNPDYRQRLDAKELVQHLGK